MEREAFLARVRSAAAAAVLPDHPEADPGLLVPDLPEVDLVATFVEVLSRTDGVVHTGDPLAAIGSISEAAPAGPFLAWETVAELAGELERLGRRSLEARVPADASARLEHQIGYREVVMGVTAAEAAFAESGTIVVRSGPGRPRMASLVPLIHVAVLRQEDIHRSLAHWAADHAHSIAEDANVVLITGPSRTGDIEQQLNLGVHGPRELHVLLI